LKIIVLGGGLIGVTAAFWLAREGHAVSLIERRSGLGLETSYANGGQLSPSEALPWAGPEVFWRIAQWSLGLPSPFTVRLRADPAQWRWLFSFLCHCSNAAQRHGLLRNQPLARFSHEKLLDLGNATPSLFSAENPHRPGILRLFHSRRDLAKAQRHQALLSELGSPTILLDGQGCVRIEPALREAVRSGSVIGGLYAPQDASADAFAFMSELSRAAQEMGVDFMLGTNVQGPARWRAQRREKTLLAVKTSNGDQEADAFVIALGNGSAAFARKLDLHLPIYPVKGYSLTMTAQEGAPHVSLTDESRRVVISRLGMQLRAAGIADVVGYDTGIDKKRADTVLDALRILFPSLPIERPDYWAGLRPMTPDCGPILGQGRQKRIYWRNVYLNTGHGSLGWTMACGSAALIADLIGGRTPSLPLENLGAERFAA
jgi:D-amino-acid dehydrogenase